MLTRDDLIDLIVSQLTPLKAGNSAPAPSTPGDRRTADMGKQKAGKTSDGPAGRIFVSEYEIKKLLKPGAKEIRLPAGAIVSPLAADWLTLQGVRIVRP
jgi:hypothetical protein